MLMCEDGKPCPDANDVWEMLQLDVGDGEEHNMMDMILVHREDPTRILIPAFSKVQGILALLEGVEAIVATREDGLQWGFLPIEWVEKHNPDIINELKLLREAVAERQPPQESQDDSDRGDGRGTARDADGGRDPSVVHP